MRVVGISRDSDGQVWATIGGCVPVDMPIDSVPRDALLRFIASRRGVASVGGLALGGLVDELQSAGRARTVKWANQLNQLALRWLQYRERYRGLLAAAGSAKAPAEVLDRLNGALSHAEERRAQLRMVRDWLYSVLGELSDIDTHDQTDRRNGLGGLMHQALGAIAVPVQIAAVLAGTSLAAWIAYQVRQAAEHRRLVEQRGQMVEGLANARNEQERRAFTVGLSQIGDELEDDEGWGVGHWLALLALGAGAGAVLKKVFGR